MTASPPPASKRRGLLTVLKWALCLLVVGFVATRAAEMWNDDDLQNVHLRTGWLVAAMGVYLLGWIPSAWYWRRLMQAMGQEVDVFDAVRGYYCGHLGKWVPGKAFVLVIRAGMMKSRGHSAAVAAVTATFETLLLMGTGLAFGLALFPVTNWPPQVAGWFTVPWVMPLVIGIGLAASLPVISMLLTRFATMMTPADMRREQGTILIPISLVAVGLAVFCLSWALLGLSLGLTIRAVSDAPFQLAEWPMWIGAIASATSIGFIAIFAPGGVGVREGLLIEILRIQPGVGVKQAIVVSVLLRLTWLVAEIFAAGGLYYAGRKSNVEN